MATRKLWKRYSDGEVRSIEINDTDENVRHCLRYGFFLTEKEAADGKVAEDKPKRRARRPKKPPEQE